MTIFALASELPRLSPTQRDSVTHIIVDDGEWTPAQITRAIALWRTIDPPSPDDWTRKDGELL